MSPRAADPAVRVALIETAARLLSAGQPLTLRRVAADAGCSTMAVYTHFGGMDELRKAVRQEGFVRLAEHLAAIGPSEDPSADLAALGFAYCLNGLHNPDLYRVMFVDVNVDPDEAAEAAATFLPLVDAVARCQAAGRFADDEAWGPSIELWAFAHGLVTLTLGGMLIVSDLFRHLESGLAASFVGYGDEPEAVGRSVRTAYCRIAPAGGFPSVTTKGTDLATLLSQVRR